MKQIRNKGKAWLVAVLAICMLTLSLGLIACGGGKDLKIDVPERIEADLGTGTYVAPRYDVVNNSGVIMAGYTVRLKSVTDPNGEAAEISREASTIVTLVGAGEYTFVYTADSKNVADATVKIDFADRVAPTIKLSSSQFPAFYIKNVTYTIPEYTLDGDFVASKCYTKLYYNDGENADEELPLDNGSFKVAKDTGKYTILIHVEDAAGNFNEYSYSRNVDSPANYEDDIVIYFNEAFGNKQVSPEGNYAGKFVSKADGGKAYGNEAGSYKIEFGGDTTVNNEAYFALNVPAIANIMEYKELEMYVYIDDEDCPKSKDSWIVGSKWWNDTSVSVGDWKRITWSVENWGNGRGENSGATVHNVISTDNIAGTRIRLIPDGDYAQKTPPHATVYFSAIRAIPYQWSEITAENDVIVSSNRVKYGEVVQLTAPTSAKTFDCFLVDGKPIAGNRFFATKDNHTVSVKFIDGALTKDNMTWAEVSEYETAGTDAKCFAVGNSDYWVFTTKAYGMDSGWCYTGAYIGGAANNPKIIGFEIAGDNNESKKCGTYGHPWTNDHSVNLTATQANILRNAKEATPVELIYIRTGDTVRVFMDDGNGAQFITSVSVTAIGVSGDNFGIGERLNKDITSATLKDSKFVAGETNTMLYMEDYISSITLDKVTIDKQTVYIGDTITLTADAPESGKMFAYFTVDGVKFDYNTFVATNSTHSIAAVYNYPSVLTFGEGVTTADGKTTVAQQSIVTLVFNGTVPQGKYFKGFKVDNVSISGRTFTPTAATHNITAEFADIIVSGNKQLNDASTVKSTSDVKTGAGNPGWMPSQTEYVTSHKYSGVDGDVKESGLLKVTLKKGEQAFAFKSNPLIASLTEYKEFYFYAYTEDTGLKGGAWWCGDTVLVPGQWTKVAFSRTDAPQNVSEASVWTANSIAEFIYRIQVTSAGSVVYVTSVYGVPYPDVSVTVDSSVDSHVSISAPRNGETYVEAETVTLSCDSVPSGKLFAYFTVNGERHDSNTYTLGTTAVTFGAVFNDSSTLTLGEGVTTADGKTTVAQGVKVELLFDSSKLNGKILDCFVIDKGTANEVKVYNGEFITSAATHTVNAVLIDNANDVTWANVGTYSLAGGDAQCYTLGSDDYWAISVKVQNMYSGWFYTGAYIGGAANNPKIIGFEITENNAEKKCATYGSPWDKNHSVNLTDAQFNLLRGKNGTTSVVELIYIRTGDTLRIFMDDGNGAQFITSVSLTTLGLVGNNFGIGGRASGPTNATLSGEKFIVGEDKVTLYKRLYTSTISCTKATANKSTVDIGETVTLTEQAAESGKIFVYFTVDGDRIYGNTFVATKSTHTVEAVYANESTLTLGEGVTTADGKTTVAQGVKVKLLFDSSKLKGKILDCFVIDKGPANEVKVYNGEFITSAATHTVEAVLVEPSNITWGDGAGYNYATTMGVEASVWAGRELDGEVYGSAEYWAVSVDVQFSKDWKSFEFIQGKNQSIRLRFHEGGYFGVILMTGKADETTPSSEFVQAYPNKNTAAVNKLLAGTTVTCVRNGDTISMYMDGEIFFTTSYAVDHEGNWFGVGHVTGNDASKPTMSNTKFIVGEDKVEAYLSALTNN